MRTMRATLLRLIGMFAKERRDRGFLEEFEFHLQMRIDDNIRAGMTPVEARRVALVESGGLEFAKEACRDRSGAPSLESFAQDLRYAIRTLRRTPMFTGVAIISLALGIGATTSVFTLINSL